MKTKFQLADWQLKALFLVLTVLAMPVVMAQGSKRLTYDIDAAAFERLELEMAIGEMDIEISDDDSISLDIYLEADRRWFSLRRPDISDVELEQRPRGDSLYLGIDRDNLEQTWRVRLPARLALEIKVGVGDISLDGLDNSLSLELGVGAVSVDVASENFREVTASAGVGDAVVRGFQNSDNERRSLVGANAFYQGDGDYHIDVEVGVGDVQIRRR
jgi:hypothetical protein